MMTYEDFERQALWLTFAAASAQTSQKWEWVRPSPAENMPAVQSEGYLCLKDVVKMSLAPCVSEGAAARSADFCRASADPCAGAGMGMLEAFGTAEADMTEALQDLGLEEHDLEHDDPSVLLTDHNLRHFHVYEYHVVYSQTYGVPVLYVRGRTRDGAMIRTQDVWLDVCPVHCWPSGAPQGCLSSASHLADDWLVDSGLPTPAPHPITGEPFLMLHPCRTHDFMSQALNLRLATASSSPRGRGGGDGERRGGESEGGTCSTRAVGRGVSESEVAGEAGGEQGRAEIDDEMGDRNGNGHASTFMARFVTTQAGTPVEAELACAGSDANSHRYLIMWLSVFGSAVGLRLPLTLLTSLDKTEQH